MKYIYLLVSVFFIFFSVNSVNSSMTGGDFEIYADSLGVLSSDVSTGGGFTLYDTAGEFFATTTSGNSFELKGGFQALEKGILSFSVGTSSLDLGTLSTASVSSAQVAVTISTESTSGYTISVSEDGDLRSGTDTIDDVADGSVTAGSEEYGITTSGGDGLFTNDQAISGSLNIASFSGPSASRGTTAILRASADSNTQTGTYSHVLTFTATVNP